MTNKTLIITGASRGIGFATAELFLSEGWDVINISRSDCDINNVQNINLDLTQHNWQESFVNKLPGDFSPEKICLVHNAALLQRDHSFDINPDQFRNTLELNVIAPSILNQILMPKMNQGSSVIFIGSTLSEIGVPNAASYVISKHAIAGAMKACCQDLAGSGVHTCCICPGTTDTEMLREYVGHDENTLKMFENMVGAKRLVRPDEIAKTIFFSANNPVINGSVIHANLGQLAQ